MRTLALGLLVSLAACAADTGDETDDDVDSTGEELSSPSSFNPGHMHHVEVCAKLANDKVALRFADGTPNGFELEKNQLVFGADAAACKKQVEALGDRV